MTIGQAAASTVRYRARELAMLRVLGFTNAELRRTLSTRVVAQAAAGTLPGWVAGLVTGRLVWNFVAGTVPLPVVTEIPPAALVAVPAASVTPALLVTNLFRRSVERLRRAVALRQG